MDNAFKPILDIVLSMNIDSEIDKISRNIEDIESLCSERGIPYAAGELSVGDNGFIFSIQQAATFKNDSEYMKWLRKVSPSFVAIIPKIATYEESKDRIAGMILTAAREADLYERLLEIQEYVKDKCIGFDIHAFFCNGNVRVDYSFGTLLGLIFPTGLSYDSEDDDFDDYEDDYEEMSEEELRKHAFELANSEGFNLAKNQAERVNLAKRIFKESVDEYDIEKIAKEAAPIYKMEVLPVRVKSLNSSGKGVKEISEMLGESQTKIKQIIAISVDC